MNQRVDRSSQGSFRAQCLQQHSGESSFVPDYSVQSLISQGECRSWMQRERSFTSAATCEKKIQMLALGFRLQKSLWGRTGCFQKGHHTACFSQLHQFLWSHATSPVRRLICLKLHPGKFSYAFCGCSRLGWLEMMEAASSDCSPKMMSML